MVAAVKKMKQHKEKGGERWGAGEEDALRHNEQRGLCKGGHIWLEIWMTKSKQPYQDQRQEHFCIETR